MKHLFDACWSKTKYTSIHSLRRQSRFRMIGEAKTLRAPGAMLIGECLCQPNILLFTANSRKIIPKYEFLVKHFKTSRICHHRQQHCYRGNQGRSGENQHHILLLLLLLLHHHHQQPVSTHQTICAAVNTSDYAPVVPSLLKTKKYSCLSTISTHQ